MIWKFGKEYFVMPQTYVLPEDYKKFKFDKESEPLKKGFYILKPTNSACGRGIRVISKKSKVSKNMRQVACKYVHKPHLINGYKYDLRLYVLVTSYDPLKIYLFHNGLVRFATAKYSTSKKTLKKWFIHLTNYSVNKKSSNYVKS